MRLQRRDWLQMAACAAMAPAVAVAAPPAEKKEFPLLTGEVGITTGSFMRHLTIEPQAGKLRLLDLPKIMRDELGMRVIDLMTRTLASLKPEYLDQLREEAEKAGCLLTNLKMNQIELEPGSPDEAVRRQAIAEYQKTIDTAARLGVRWVRPMLGSKPDDLKHLTASLRELADHAATKQITLLIENLDWLKGEPAIIPQIVEAVGKATRAQPDTGNWTDAARYEGLAKAFPLAASCDFKALVLGPDNSHSAYDLKRCFDIGWQAGFRGPWCLEHFHEDLPTLFREMVWLKDRLHEWMRNAKS